MGWSRGGSKPGWTASSTRLRCRRCSKNTERHRKGAAQEPHPKREVFSPSPRGRGVGERGACRDPGARPPLPLPLPRKGGGEQGPCSVPPGSGARVGGADGATWFSPLPLSRGWRGASPAGVRWMVGPGGRRVGSRPGGSGLGWVGGAGDWMPPVYLGAGQPSTISSAKAPQAFLVGKIIWVYT
jgi:hypothetical protein